MEIFSDWLEEEIKKRTWRPTDLASKARLKTGTITRILNGTRNAGPDACSAIARALNYSPEVVFRQAGLLPPAPEPDLEVEEVTHLFEQLATDDRKRILKIRRTWVENGGSL